MCVSNNFIEQQAYDLSEQIRKNTRYAYVKTVFSVDGFVSSNIQEGKELPLVSKVILEDDDGTLYQVGPSLNGLKFAKKEITYSEYKKLEKRESRHAILSFLGCLIGLGSIMVLMLKLFT
ncbi:hypothetical protein EKG37_17805 [Robertmurraya yapensis]|uniref:Uncharacterized protein n=1 Tax=Bacillus yapensis TaxID=2492960 RepID=A0A431VXY0_9BACI|nr:hypothetical protein [Bacillus yapensis]RTR28157.1 hypothetical protein EKG37_17805 [Bacillus yapensis]TKS94400.1 hypothetical protein FAR12_17810 [Bacillus yapensis]